MSSSIEWTGETWPVVAGCTRKSEGCDHCYAVRMSYRQERMALARRAKGQSEGRSGKYVGLTVLNPRGERHFNGKVVCDEGALEMPLKWKKPRKIFVASMADLFHLEVPFEFIDKVFAVMALCPQHTFQVLTKRPERMAEYLGGGTRHTNFHVYNAAATMINGDWSRMPGDMASTRSSGGTWWPLPNVWLGTSAENQKLLQERLKHLVQCPAAVRFLSCEPLLGPINLNGRLLVGQDAPDGDVIVSPAIHWVIVGGESGPGARGCNVEWIREIVLQCGLARVACFVKQLGAHPYDVVDHSPEPAASMARKHGIGPLVAEVRKWSLASAKGGDPMEWPPVLRVREFPYRPEAGATGSAGAVAAGGAV